MPKYDLPRGGHYDPPPLRRKYGVLPLRLARVNAPKLPKYAKILKFQVFHHFGTPGGASETQKRFFVLIVVSRFILNFLWIFIFLKGMKLDNTDVLDIFRSKFRHLSPWYTDNVTYPWVS